MARNASAAAARSWCARWRSGSSASSAAWAEDSCSRTDGRSTVSASMRARNASCVASASRQRSVAVSSSCSAARRASGGGPPASSSAAALLGARGGRAGVEQRSQRLAIGVDGDELVAHRGRVGDERLDDSFVGRRGELALQSARARRRAPAARARAHAPTRRMSRSATSSSPGRLRSCSALATSASSTRSRARSRPRCPRARRGACGGDRAAS